MNNCKLTKKTTRAQFAYHIQTWAKGGQGFPRGRLHALGFLDFESLSTKCANFTLSYFGVENGTPHVSRTPLTPFSPPAHV